MADSLCGPSNALQSFQKHSTVDRTLQQDRLVSRQLPSQGFRSHHGSAGTLDPEFEAFQAGHAPPQAFAGPVFPTHHSFVSSQSHIHPASTDASSSSASPSWTQDFQRLNLSQPQQQPQHMPHAWNAQFRQNDKSPAHFQTPSTHYQTQPLQFRPSPAFLQSQAPFHMQGSHQAMNPPELQAPLDHFDEAAFEAAFDQAMADATTDQDQYQDQAMASSEQEHSPLQVDTRPHLPLFRLALAYSLVANTDESLHKAALIINHLARHARLNDVDLMLFRPLLSALQDPKRSLFSERYGFERDLILDHFHYDGTETAPMAIDQTTERLLAAYSDLLWQRDQSTHLSPANRPRSADNAKWLDKFYDREHDETVEVFAGSLTGDCVWLLNNDFQRQVIPVQDLSQSHSLNRVLELEFDALSHKFPSAGVAKSSRPEETQASLFTLMESMLEAPETVETFDHLRHEAQIVDANVAEQVEQQGEVQMERRANDQNHSLQDYQLQLQLLEQQNKKRLLYARAASAQNSLKERHAQEVMQAQQAEEEAMGLSDPSHHQFEEQPKILDPGHHQFEEQPQHQQHQQQQQQPPHDQQHDEELAQTAADLLERVAHNKTDKFKNSAFLGLMRQLADREVRVEGDKVVPTNETVTSTGLEAQHFVPTIQQPSDTGISPTNDQQSNPGPQDGQEVADLLNQPESIVSNQDSEFMMTSPFAHPEDY